MITIDGTSYAVSILEENRSADMLFKYAERTEDGILHSELIGCYFNYKGLRLGKITDTTLYASLWQKLTEPVESHSITVFDETGEYTFDAYFANIKDALRIVKAGMPYWKDLTFDIVAISPARTPA
jgi:hypothetical protein